MNNSLAQPGTP